MASFQTFGIVLCVSLLVVLPSPAEARATGGWLRFLKMLEEMKEDRPFPAEDYPEEFDAAILHPSTPPPEEEDYEDAAEPMEPWMRPPPLLPPAGEEEAPVRACYAWHGLTEHARKWIVWQHNVYRSTVAKGKESQGNPGPQPQASNMRVMYWDSSLEAIAQGWADTCPQGHNPDVLPGGKYSNLGENYARYWTSADTNKDEWMGKKIAIEFIAGGSDTWYDEVSDWSRHEVSNFQGSNGGPAIGHYTQMVWAKADRVGCGVSANRDGDYNSVVLVCNYNTGNIISLPVYKKGAPCSACPSGKQSCWKGMCY